MILTLIATEASFIEKLSETYRLGCFSLLSDSIGYYIRDSVSLVVVLWII